MILLIFFLILITNYIILADIPEASKVGYGVTMTIILILILITNKV